MSTSESITPMLDSCFKCHSLRSIVRGILASGLPDIGSTFTAAARERMRAVNHSVPSGIYAADRDEAHPTEQFRRTLAETRCLYGAGMGFDALRMMAVIVDRSIGLRWVQDGEMARALTEIDTDISQAIQVSSNRLELGWRRG